MQNVAEQYIMRGHIIKYLFYKYFTEKQEGEKYGCFESCSETGFLYNVCLDQLFSKGLNQFTRLYLIVQFTSFQPIRVKYQCGPFSAVRQYTALAEKTASMLVQWKSQLIQFAALNNLVYQKQSFVTGFKAAQVLDYQASKLYLIIKASTGVL